MNTSRHSRTRQPTAHKLQQRHLRTRILHRHAIRLQLEIRLTPNIPSSIRIAQQRLLGALKMRIEYLLCQSQLARGTEYAPDFFEPREQFGVRWGARAEVDVARGGRRVRCGEASERLAEGGEMGL